MKRNASVTDRQAFPDELRGIALLGIVLVNAPFLLISSGGLIDGKARDGLDAAAEWFVAAFFQGKSYLLFAALFGYGAALMLRLDRGERDAAATRRYRRRLVGLGAIGVLHAALLFAGDILVPYALIGLLVPWLALQADRRLLRIAGAAWGLAVGVLALLVIGVLAEPGSATVPASVTTFDEALATGGFLEAVSARAAFYPSAALTLAVLNWPLVLACFCVGLWAGRRRLLADPSALAASPQARRVGRLALLVGVPTGVLAGALQAGVLGAGIATDVGGVALGFATAPVLSAGYVVWLARRSGRAPLRWMTAGGRRSLTVYVGESLLLVVLASGWGLGLFGDVGPAAVLGLAIGVWLVLELLARAHATRFAQGPLERVLRRWTYAGTRRPAPREPAPAGGRSPR